MTALHKFERLESLGQWQAHADAAHVEVIVQLGRHTLTVIGTNGAPIAHWALGSLILEDTANPFQLRADMQSGEVLSLTDTDMIQAMRLIKHAAAPRHTIKARYILTAAAALAIAGAGWMALQKIPTYVAHNLPMAVHEPLGLQILAHLGNPCTTPEGLSALQRIETQLAPLGEIRLHVLPIDADHVIALPGGHYILPQNMLLQSPSPDVLAGHVIEAVAATLMVSSIHQVTHSIGTWDNVTLLAQGALPDGALQSAAKNVVDTPQLLPPTQNLAQAFDITSVNAAPFARDQAYDTLLALNTHPNAAPILQDGAFLGLKQICD